MIFLSQLIGVSIFDSRQENIGKVKDVVVGDLGKDYPVLQGIIFKKGGVLFYIDYKFVETIGYSEVTLNSRNCFSEYEEDIKVILLSRDVLDEQIFDVEGIRVVRVNDLHLVKIKEEFKLVGIDISNKALVRRLGLSFLPFYKYMTAKIIDWDKVNFVREKVGEIKLKTPYQKLEKLHPADIANLIENLSLMESSAVFQSIDEEKAAEVLAEVEPKYKDVLLEKMNPQNLAEILEEMPTDEACDVIQDLSEVKRNEVFNKLGVSKANELVSLSRYEEDMAGGLMITHFLFVNVDDTVEKAIEKIRTEDEEHKSIYHIYVLDNDSKLQGVVSIRTLLLAKKKEKIADLMSRVYKFVSPETKDTEVSKILTKYNLLSVAVIDSEGVMKGVVTIDDIMRLLVPEA